MTLYHFCADRHLKAITRHGLNTGMVTEPTPTGYIMHTGYIWLTLDKDPAHQSWATQRIVKYSRTAWRLTIEIPDSEVHNLCDRAALVERWPTTAKLFDGWDGSENWRVFHGVIPPKWIVEAERMYGF